MFKIKRVKTLGFESKILATVPQQWLVRTVTSFQWFILVHMWDGTFLHTQHVRTYVIRYCTVKYN